MNNAPGHFKEVCSDCKKIISQCRCSDPNKQVTYSVCASCQAIRNKVIKANPISPIQQSIAEWSKATFGLGITHQKSWRFPGMLAHLKKEVAELDAKVPKDGSNLLVDLVVEELADCAMLLLDMANQLNVDLLSEVKKKLEINKARKWGKPNPDGSVEHIRESEPELPDESTMTREQIKEELEKAGIDMEKAHAKLKFLLKMNHNIGG